MTAYSIPGIKTPEEIICQEYGLSFDDIKRHTRKKDIIECRYLIFNWYRKNTQMTYGQIGNRFGKFNCATVRYGVQEIENLTGIYRWFREKVQEIENKINLSKH